jgi:ribonucleoside-triphosphate reductase
MREETMVKTVIKRDGIKKQDFNPEKIKKAIIAANAQVEKEKRLDEDQIEKVLQNVIKSIEGIQEETIDIEQIQDFVEKSLIKYNHHEIVKAFILYREERNKERFKRYAITKEINEKLAASKIDNQNANVDEASFGGRKGEASSALNKQLALDYYMDKKTAKNHILNRIYQHDLDSWVVGQHNCISMPFDSLLKKGMKTRQTDIRPAKSIATALQLFAVGFQVQSLQQFGGVSATHVDWTLVPYFRFSFMKAFIFNYLKNRFALLNLNLENMSVEELDQWIDDNKTKYLKKWKLTVKDFTLDNKKLKRGKFKKLRQQALLDAIIETNQAVEGMYHNLNTLQSRSGNQLPFTSINYGTCTLPEGRIIIKALLNGSIKGVGKNHRTAIFPCGIFQYSKNINGFPGTPNYDLYKLALKSTSKRLYPNYVNMDWSNDTDWSDVTFKTNYLKDMTKEDQKILVKRLQENEELIEIFGLEIGKNGKVKAVDMIPSAMPSTMGCRTYTSKDATWQEDWTSELKKTIENKNYQPVTFASSHMKDGRGNICPATIILPTLAMEAKKKAEKAEHPEYIVDYFMDILEKAISDCKDSLIERFNWICAQSPDSAKFMYENNTFFGYKPEEGIRSALRHGSLAVGQLGLAECLQILVGCNQVQPKGMEVAKKIEQLFKDKCAEYKEYYKLNFGVYYTPAENLCYTAMTKFKKKYGVIPNVSDRDYFTNSIHVPVWEQVSPFQKIDIESQLTGYSGAGCITYVELDNNAPNNLDSLEEIVNYAMAKDIPYFALNVPVDYCECCGYQGFIDNECPICHNNDENQLQRLRRVTGYLSTDYRHFNYGKQQEVKDRFKHTQNMQSWKKNANIQYY